MASRNHILRLIRKEIRASEKNPFDITGGEIIPILEKLSKTNEWLEEWYRTASKSELTALSNDYDKWRNRRMQS